jgi:hypothetical protein
LALSTGPSHEGQQMNVYLSPDQVVQLLPGISRGRLAQLRFHGSGPAYRQPTPKTILYVEEEVIEWVEASKRRSTGE